MTGDLLPETDIKNTAVYKAGYQAGIDGAVEILKSKKASQGLVFNLVGRSKLEEAKTANLLNQALNDTIKALQDNK